MALKPRLIKGSSFTPRSIPGLALWLDGSDTSRLYTTDAGPVTAVAAPTDISGCALWLDASDASSITASSGLVSQWSDKSGLGNHATASGTTRPTTTPNGLNGLSVMTFDGTANSMAITANAAFNTNDLTYFVVFKQAGLANKGVYTKLNATAGTKGFGLVLRSDPQVWLLQKNAGDSQILTSSTNPVTQARIYSVTSSSSAAGYLDGLSSASASSTADHSLSQTVRIGSRESSEYLNGYIAEVIHFNTALSATDRARVEAYLAAKWGISGVHAQATNASDPVGYWGDKSGNNRHATQATAGSRPTVGTQNGRAALTFNGLTQKLGGSAPVTSLPVTIIAAAKPTADNILAPIYGQLSGTSATAYLYRRFNDGTLNNRFRLFNDGTGSNNLSSVTLWPQNTAAVVGATVAASSGSHALYFQGLISATTGSTGTLSPAGDYLLAASTAASSANHFGGDYYEVLIYNRVLTTSQRQRLERYLASKWSIALAPQVSNADAQDWISRVYANGGTVSSSTAAAVNSLCDSIDSVSGLRACFYRLNPFAGTGLPAALVPLYRGPAYGGTTYGGTTDTNVGPFVTANYTEATGLTNDLSGASGKYLRTGLTPGALPSFATGHLSAYPRTGSGDGNVYALISSLGASLANNYNIELNRGAGGILAGQWGGGTFGTLASSGTGNGMLIVTRTSSTLLTAYRNGTAIGTRTASTTPATSDIPFAVFAQATQSTGDVLSSDRYVGSLGCYSIGAAMDATQAAAYSTAMIAFQTALTRNV